MWLEFMVQPFTEALDIGFRCSIICEARHALQRNQ